MEYSAGHSVLAEGVEPETRDIGYFKRKFGFQDLPQIIALPIVHSVVDQCLHLRMILRADVDASYVSIHSDHRGSPAERWRSEAHCSTPNASNAVISISQAPLLSGYHIANQLPYDAIHDAD